MKRQHGRQQSSYLIYCPARLRYDFGAALERSGDARHIAEHQRETRQLFEFALTRLSSNRAYVH
jgi:hypothetical protein